LFRRWTSERGAAYPQQPWHRNARHAMMTVEDTNPGDLIFICWKMGHRFFLICICQPMSVSIINQVVIPFFQFFGKSNLSPYLQERQFTFFYQWGSVNLTRYTVSCQILWGRIEVLRPFDLFARREIDCLLFISCSALRVEPYGTILVVVGVQSLNVPMIMFVW